jgi:hypothetical protein
LPRESRISRAFISTISVDAAIDSPSPHLRSAF